MTDAQVMNEVRDNDYRMTMPETSLCSEDFYRLMNNCWTKEPHKRTTFESLFNLFSLNL